MEQHNEQPSFLPLLNAIAVNECKGEQLLKAWADTTPDKQLAETLRFVAIREGEHSWAFTKRMCELGHEVCEDTAYKAFKDFDALLACVKSPISDAEKVARLRGNDRAEGAERKDPFRGFFKDTSIDPTTGALLGRYICEERDSGRRLQAEYDRVCGAGHAQSSELAEIKACMDALRQEIAELKGLRSVA